MMRFTGVVLVATFFSCGSARAGDWFFEEFVAPYRQRLDSITSSAGNAKHVNSITHVIDPWPRRVGDRHIQANGERMVGAAERYRDPRKLRDAPASLPAAVTGQSAPPNSTSTPAPVPASATGR